MIAIAHFVAISLYLGATALAAAPFARPMRAPVRGVVIVLHPDVELDDAVELAELLRERVCGVQLAALNGCVRMIR